MSGIYSLRDLRAVAPPELRNASDSTLIVEYAKDLGADPTEVARFFGHNNSGGMASNRIAAGIDNYQANWYGLGGAVARKVGANNVAGWMDQRREANELDAATSTLRARDLGAVDDWRDVRGVGTGLNYVGGLLAQSAPYLAEAAVGGIAARAAMTGTRAALAGAQTVDAAQKARRALNLGSMAGAAAVSYPSAVGGVLSAQRDAGAAPGEERLGMAALGGVPYAALNAVGAGGVVARGLRPIAGSAERGLLARMGREGGRTSLTEGIAETGQEGVNQYFGRMAVDPNETMFNPDANRRYVDSFIGGAALGGTIGSLSGIRRPIDESFNYDLTQRANTPAPAPSAPGYNLTTDMSPIQGRIDSALGINRNARRGYAQDFAAAFNEPSGQFVVDPQTGLERELSVGEYQQIAAGVADQPQATTTATASPAPQLDPELDAVITDRTGLKPNNKLRSYAQRLLGLELETVDPDADVAVWNALSERKYGRADRLLKPFEEASNAGQNVVAPAGAPTTQPAAPGATPVATPTAQDAPAVGTPEPTAAEPVPAPGVDAIRANDGSVNPVVSSGQQAGLPTSATAGVGVSSPLSDTAPTNLMERGQQPAPPMTESAIWDEHREDDQLAWDQLPANQQQIWREALQVKNRGGRVNLYRVAEELGGQSQDARLTMLKNIFGDRDGEIIFDVVGTGMSEEAAAKKYGTSRSNIQKIAGATGKKNFWPAKIRAAADRFGYTPEQIASTLSPQSSEAAAGRSEVEQETQVGMRNMFDAGKVDPLDAQLAGLEGTINTPGGSQSEVVGIDEQAKAFDAALERLRQ
ncbi:MAG: hypothetical protein B7Z13_03765, partial [Caulobacterales bacterium 32-67-6]